MPHCMTGAATSRRRPTTSPAYHVMRRILTTVQRGTCGQRCGHGGSAARVERPSVRALVAGVVPGSAEADRDVHRHFAERVGAGHLAAYQLFDGVSLPRRDLE